MVTSSNKAVVVTGASTGIGRSCAIYLAKRGYTVFAGVRRQADAIALQSEAANIIPIDINVTQDDSIAAAVIKVEQEVGALGLHGLVNNAGVGIIAPIEYVPLADLRHQFEVNVFGQIAVTQRFLPLIRKARGRVVNMGSVGIHITMPFGGPLCASKSALGSLSDALRLELHPFGIHVCMVEPASISTPAVDKTMSSVDTLLRNIPQEGTQRYGTMLREFVTRASRREKQASSPDVVAKAVHHALTAKHPQVRYAVGKDSTKLTFLSRAVPERLLDRLLLKLFGMPERFGEIA